MNVYTVIKATRSLAIVELKKSCSKRKRGTFYEGIDVLMGPYAPAYRLYTGDTETEAIMENFRDQYRKIRGMPIHVGEVGKSIMEDGIIQYHIIIGGIGRKSGRARGGRCGRMVDEEGSKKK